jgi:hypothetical protein
LEEVSARAGHEVLMVDNDYNSLIVDPQGILYQQFRPHSFFCPGITDIK